MFPPEIHWKIFPDIHFLPGYTWKENIPWIHKNSKNNFVEIFSDFSDISEMFLCEKYYTEMCYFLTFVFFFLLLHMEIKRLFCFQKTFFMSEKFLLKKALEFLQK